MYITGEFQSPAPVVTAIQSLAGAGLDKDSIEIFSEKPVELPEGLLDREGHTSLAAVLGGIVNGGLATGFIYYTQHDYPLITGGMPLTSGWATGVITYELAMAGAIAGTILAFLWEARLFRRRKAGAPPVLKNGSIFVQVACAPESVRTVEERLSQAGAVEISKEAA